MGYSLVLDTRGVHDPSWHGRHIRPPESIPMSNESDSPQAHPQLQTFFEAIGNGEADTIRELVREAPELLGDCNGQGLSPILWALYNRKPQLTSLLKELGAPQGAFELCAMGEEAGLQELLDQDPGLVHAEGKDNFTLLHLASFFGREEIVANLIAKGADVNAITQDENKLAPLHAAAAGGSITATVKLLEAGANPDVAQKGGFTPLMSAAGSGNQAMANSLLRAGATAGLKSEDGRTALDLAKSAGHKKLVAFLTSK